MLYCSLASLPTHVSRRSILSMTALVPHGRLAWPGLAWHVRPRHAAPVIHKHVRHSAQHGCSSCFKTDRALLQLVTRTMQQSTSWSSLDQRTVCSQLSRLLAVATPDTCFFFFFPHRSHVSFSLFFFVRCPRSL